MEQPLLDADLLTPDVLILGSGLQETYIAWQLAAAGLRILHLDSNPHYGGSQAALTLSELTNLLTQSNTKTTPFTNATITPSLPAKLIDSRRYCIALAPHLIFPNSKLYKILREAERTEVYSWGVVDGFFTYIPTSAEGQSGESGVLGAVAGQAVRVQRKWNKRKKGSVSSIGSATSERPSTAGSVASVTEIVDRDDALAPSENAKGRFRRVPSSEEDIAWATDISDRDRATMGLFLRSAVKPPAEDEPNSSPGTEETLEQHLTNSYPLPPSLISRLTTLLLTHTPPSSIPLSTALGKLRNHASNLGSVTNVPSAASLVVSYGQLGELCQDWARMVAVNGGVNILGRGIKTIAPPSSNSKEGRVEVELETGEKVSAGWVLGNSYEFPSPSDVNSGGNVLRKGVYIIDGELEALFAFKGKNGKVERGQLASSSVVYFPTGSVGNQDAGEERNDSPILTVVRGQSTADCPAGQTVLYLSALTTGEDMFGPAVETLLNGCAWGEKKPEIVWKAEWDQAVGTGTIRQDGNVVRLGELAADLSVGDDVWEGLDMLATEIVEDVRKASGEA